MADYQFDCVTKYVLPVATSPAIAWATPAYLVQWLRSRLFSHVVASICYPMLEESRGGEGSGRGRGRKGKRGEGEGKG